MFGELGILMARGRTATVTAAQQCELAVIDANFYRSLLKDIEYKKILERIEFFTEHFFHGMPQELIVKFCYNFELKRLIKN